MLLPDTWIDELTLWAFGSADRYYTLALIGAVPVSIFFLVIIELGYTIFVNN